MKKTILTILAVIVLCLGTAFSAFAEGEVQDFRNSGDRVIDNAGLLTDSQKADLNRKIDEIRVRQKLDIVVLTTATLDGAKTREYADDYFDYNSYGYGMKRDGLLLLISIEENDWYISTHGYAIYAFTDDGISYIGKKLKPYLSGGDFAGAFDAFAELCDDFVSQARNETPYNSFNLPKEPISWIWIPISLVIGLLLATGTVKKMKNKLKTVRFQSAAGSYMKKESLNITEKRDLFLYRTVSRTAKPKNESSGGSSTHTSSSGSTHGGGGGKF